MIFTEKEFIPVVFGGDINTYSVARAFYEQYGVRSYIFGKFPSGPSFASKMITYTADEAIDTDPVFLNTVRQFCAAHKDKTVILIGCGDNYVALISRHKKDLPPNAVAPYIDFDLMNRLQHKELFYQLCDRHDIDYPATVIHRKEMGLDFELPFPFPVILKPSDSIMYWEYPFPAQKKVYKLDTREELNAVITQIYKAGYHDSLIIQDVIPGNDEYMRVLTAYSGRDRQVKMMCLGHVLLEEHTPHGLGNHAVIITEFKEDLMLKVKRLLEDLQYTGFSNFDIKYDIRDGKYKFFEINTRQGRSNYYVTGSGLNLAKYVVEDYIYNRSLPLEMAKDEHLWWVVPKGVAYKYVKQPENLARMKQLAAAGKSVNPVFKKGDFTWKRWLHMVKNHLSHYQKFKTYYH